MRERGFSLLEMLVVVAVFVFVTGAVFLLLNVAQQRYMAESQRLDAFQSARIALDQITRDIHDAGYPPVISAPGANPTLVAFPFAWDKGYPALCNSPAPSGAGGDCKRSPSGYDIVLESNASGGGVQWIRYSLMGPTCAAGSTGTTLCRGVTAKVAGVNPVDATNAFMVPYVENVLNNAPAAQIAAIQVAYPGTFNNLPTPIFSWAFDANPAPPGTNPPYIREVTITLIVQSEQPDPRTNQPQVVALTGLARRFNPSF